jgi:UPF0288 family protein (methanogenesis marker protein 3)
VSTLCGIITAIGGLVIAYLKKKTNKLEKERDKYRSEKNTAIQEIQVLHNGFRENIYKEIRDLRIKFDSKTE